MQRQKTCSICGQTLPVSEFHRRRHYVRSGYRAACKRCTSLKARQARERHPPERDRKKERVRSKTRALIELGQLEPGPCKVCGDADVQAHHLEVVAVFDDDDAHYDIDEHDGKRRPVVVGCTPLSRILKVIFSDKEVPYLRIITSYEAEGRWLNAYLSRKGVS